MGETLPNPINNTEFEQHQVTNSNPNQELLEMPKSETYLEQPESYFDRRHEIKDESAEQTITNIQPMIPISLVLKSRTTPQPAQPHITFTSNQSPTNKLSFIVASSYTSAILKGFGAGLIIIAVTVGVFLIRVLNS